MLTRQNRIALHMVDATATELPRTRNRYPPLLPWWMKGALLVLFVAIVIVATARILRAAL